MMIIKPPRPVNGFAHTEQSCRSKPPYINEGVAMLRLLAFRRAGGDADRTMQAYPCTYCGQWHLGHRPGTLDQNGEMRGGRERQVILERKKANP